MRAFSKYTGGALFNNLDSLSHIVITSEGCDTSVYPGISNKLIVWTHSERESYHHFLCYWKYLLHTILSEYWHTDLWLASHFIQHIPVWHFALALPQILHVYSFDFLLTWKSQMIRLPCWHLAWSDTWPFYQLVPPGFQLLPSLGYTSSSMTWTLKYSAHSWQSRDFIRHIKHAVSFDRKSKWCMESTPGHKEVSVEVNYWLGKAVARWDLLRFSPLKTVMSCSEVESEKIGLLLRGPWNFPAKIWPVIFVRYCQRCQKYSRSLLN